MRNMAIRNTVSQNPSNIKNTSQISGTIQHRSKIIETMQMDRLAKQITQFRAGWADSQPAIYFLDLFREGTHKSEETGTRQVHWAIELDTGFGLLFLKSWEANSRPQIRNRVSGPTKAFLIGVEGGVYRMCRIYENFRNHLWYVGPSTKVPCTKLPSTTTW